MDADGDFVVAWESSGEDASSYGVFARRFNVLGAPQGIAFQVNSYTTNNQYRPSVDLDSDGGFVVAWQSTGQDGSNFGVFARRFNSLGVALTSEFQVNTFTSSAQRTPSVGVDARGDFVIAWVSTQDPGDGVFARHFNGAGPQGTEFQLNTYTTGNQNAPAVKMNGGGDFVVAWQSTGQDGNSYSVFAQRFATLAPLDVDGNGLFEPLTDGLLILRFGFGFTGQTLISGAVGAGCTRCDPASILAYLQTMS